MIRLQCDCGRQIAAPQQWLGKRVKCPQCGRPVVVLPVEQALAEAVAARGESGRHIEPNVTAESQFPESEGDLPAPTVTTEAVESEPPRGIDSDPMESESPSNDASPSDGEEPELNSIDSRIPTEVQAPSAEAEPSSLSSGDTAPAPRPAPPRRLLAPAPPVNAVMHVPIPEEEDEREYDPRRTPRILGTVALLVALGAGTAYWFPVAKPWAVPAAGVGLTLAAIGFTLAMSRHRLGYWIPLLALIVSSAALSLPSFTRNRLAARSGNAQRVSNYFDDNSDDAKSRRILKVTLRPSGPVGGGAVELTYKLTNTSGRAIDAVYGSIQLFDNDHRTLDSLGLNMTQPLKPGGVFDGSNTWTLSDRTRTAVKEDRFTAEYRANTVVYTGGSTEDFAR